MARATLKVDLDTSELMRRIDELPDEVLDRLVDKLIPRIMPRILDRLDVERRRQGRRL